MNEDENSSQPQFTAPEIGEALEPLTDKKTAKHLAALSKSPFAGVSTDTRTIQKGDLFIALKGDNFDGHDYLETAQQKGAAGAIVHEKSTFTGETGTFEIVPVSDTLKALQLLARYHREKLSLKIIGITGSYGKTTTRAMVTAALSTQLKVLSTEGNNNNEIGVAKTLLQLNKTHQVAVLEMGMRGPGQIAELCEMAKPDYGIITNIGPQHIELLDSLENIAAAKAELLEALPADGAAIIPGDSQFAKLLEQKTQAKVIAFGRADNAVFRVRGINIKRNGCAQFLIDNPPFEEIRVDLNLPGKHNVYNAAASLALCDALDLDLEKAAAALGNVSLPAGRLHIEQLKDCTLINDCYNAGPGSTRAALEVLEHHRGKGRRIAVLGSMLELGEYSESSHKRIGKQAAQVANVVIGVGDETKVLLEKAEKKSVKCYWFADADQAANWLRDNRRRGDIILVKGSRGIHLEKVVEVIHES